MRLEFPPFYVRALDRQLTIIGAEPERKPGRPGGKPAALKLLRPIKAKSKRGQFLRTYFDAPAPYQTAKLRLPVDAVARMQGISRANVFTYWTTIQREHGIGYELENDCIKPILPPGVTIKDIFK